jgi:hypothetical protein
MLTCLVMIGVGRLAGAAMRADSKLEAPAGLGRGFLHGAMMPLALPTLLIGHDSTIYAEHNAGRTYKLGYTLGVNACGAAFFSFAFRSVRRWRDRRAGNAFGSQEGASTVDPAPAMIPPVRQ